MKEIEESGQRRMFMYKTKHEISDITEDHFKERFRLTFFLYIESA